MQKPQKCDINQQIKLSTPTYLSFRQNNKYTDQTKKKLYNFIVSPVKLTILQPKTTN